MSIADLPADWNEFYGSMISMDDPRHAKIRRIVSKVFTPRMLEQVMDSVQQVVRDVLDAARRKAEDGDGSIDVVADIAAPIPLRIICDMMGVPESDRALVLAVDAPTIRAPDLEPLLTTPSSAVAYEGLHLPLVIDIDAISPDAVRGDRYPDEMMGLLNN